MFVAVLANRGLEMGRKTLHGTGREVNAHAVFDGTAKMLQPAAFVTVVKQTVTF